MERYQVYELLTDTQYLEKFLNDKAEDGWRLCAMLKGKYDVGFIVVLAREEREAGE